MKWRHVLLAVGTTLVAQTQSTFYSAYEDAQEAMAQGRWRGAALALDRAIQLRRRPGAQVLTYGTNLLMNYYPYVQLAKCHLELGEVEAARSWLAASEREGEPKAFREPLEARLLAVASASPKASEPQPLSTQQATPDAPAEAKPQVPATQPPGDRPADRPASTETQGQELPFTATNPEPQPSVSVTPPGVGSPVLPQVPGPVAPLQSRQSGPGRFVLSVAAGLAVLTLGLLFRRRQRKPPSMPPSPPAPDRVGPYRILRRLGRGGFATTYLAEPVDGGKPVALKVPHPHLLDDPEAMQRFHQEALLGATLNHPNLVRVVDPGPEGAFSWMAFEYVEGAILESVLAEQGLLPISLAVDIALAIAEALAHAHAHGVVHRDLKPANVLMGQPIRVMDFGIARLMDAQTLTTTYAFLGTPRYSAPEAQLKTGVGPAADRYSLGILLFEMLAGQAPFEGETPFEIMERHRREPLPELRTLRPDVPEALARLVARLGRKEPDERPEDAEVIQRLKQIQAELAGS